MLRFPTSLQASAVLNRARTGSRKSDRGAKRDAQPGRQTSRLTGVKSELPATRFVARSMHLAPFDPVARLLAM